MRVLQVVTTMNRGGLETMLMNYYRHVDRERVQFDFLEHRKEHSAYDDEIESPWRENLSFAALGAVGAKATYQR